MLKYEVPWKILGLAGITIASVCGYQYYSLTDSDDQTVREDQAADLARNVSLDLPVLEGRPKLSIAPFQHDRDQIFTIQLRQWVARRNLQVIEPTWLDKATAALALREPKSSTMELQRAAEEMDGEYLLCGEVEEWVTWPTNEAKLRANIQLFNVATSELIYERVLQVPTIETSDDDEHSAAGADLAEPTPNTKASHNVVPDSDPVLEFLGKPLVVRVTIWLIVAPLLLAGVLGNFATRESNVVNGLMLSLYMLLVGVSAWLTWGHLLEIPSAWFLVVLVSLLAAPVFGHVASRIEQSRM